MMVQQSALKYLLKVLGESELDNLGPLWKAARDEVLTRPTLALEDVHSGQLSSFREVSLQVKAKSAS
jgi:hypothetical protein